MSAEKLTVSGDRLKREIPSPKDRVKPLFWTAKHLSDRVIEGGKYELKRIVEARRDAKGEWEFLCEWRGFDSSHNNWEPAQPFVHGYTKGFIDFPQEAPRNWSTLDRLFVETRQTSGERRKTTCGESRSSLLRPSAATFQG